MVELWRISQFAILNGDGGLRYSARWHHAGRPIVYLAESPAGALLEVLVHLELEPAEMPPGLTLLRVLVKDGLDCPHLKLPASASWRFDREITRQIGDGWLADGSSALARVPSVIVPHTFNVVFNPLHPGADRVSIGEVIAFDLDDRLFRDKSL